MNQACVDRKQKINNDFKSLDESIRSLFHYDEDQITERTMRLGLEARAFDLIEPEYRDVAIFSLKEDFVKCISDGGLIWL